MEGKMKISQLPYQRPDKEKTLKELYNLLDEFKECKNGAEQYSVIGKIDKILEKINSMGALAYVRFTLDTNDEFYINEKAFFDEFGAQLNVYMQKLSIEMLDSPYRKEFFSYFPPVVEKNIEINSKTANEEVVPLLIRESELTTEYTKLINNVSVPYKGKDYNLALIGKFFSDDDRNVRRESMTAAGEALAKIGEKLDKNYDDLVKVRTEIARKLGFENYSGLGYCRMMRNCYGKEDIAAFRENVKEYIVPLVTKIKAKIAEEMALDRITVYDNGVYVKTDPKPIGTPEELFKKGEAMYDALSGETSRLFRRMEADEAFDYLARPGKWGGGYCVGLNYFKTPFILANFNGTMGDVTVLTHEFGHALAAEEAFMTESSFIEATMETCEVHSMSMEFFTYPWMESFFGKNTDLFKFKHIASSLAFIPYGTIVDAFQQEVYDNPDMTPEQRNALWAKLDREFLPHMVNDGVPFYDEGRRWQRQMHIYESPFYYIDYCLAQFMAFQFLALSLKDFDSAFEKYMKFLKAGGTKSFTELIEYVDLKSPFDKEAFIEVCDTIAKLIEN